VNGAAGELRLHVGGAGEFTIAQAATMLKNITTGVNHNGLMAGATFGLDTTNATTVQDLSIHIADSQGPGGGGVTIKKCGAGTLKLSGSNTYTGPTTVKQGTLSFTNARGLGDKTEVSVADGAMLALNFKGEMHISKLILDGKLQPAGTY